MASPNHVCVGMENTIYSSYGKGNVFTGFPDDQPAPVIPMNGKVVMPNAIW